MKGEQGANPAKRHVGESYKDHADRLYGMYRAAQADLERLCAIEARAQRIVDMAPGVALPGSQATALAILEGP